MRLGKKIFKIAIVWILISIIMSSNIIVLFKGFISYASEERTQTNNENIDFDVYLITEDNNIQYEAQTNIEDNKLKIGIDLAVNNNGYLDSEITLKSGNIKIKNITDNDKINKLENNTIKLNRINAGEKIQLILETEIEHNETIQQDFTKKENIFELKGEYKDASEKITNIQSQKSVTIDITYPENQEKEILKAEVITNKIYQINNENKRLIQILVKSGLKDNLYPIKQTQIDINVPENTEKIDVISKEQKATTNKPEYDFTNENWNWNKQEKKLEIIVQNKEQDNLISWNKEGLDQFIVTFIFPENTEYKNTNFEIQRTITLYDSKNTNLKNNTKITPEDEKEGTIQYSIINNENDIYKGKMYSHQEREYQKTGTININFKEINGNIEVTEIQDKYIIENKQINANSIYKNITFNKTQLQKILGQTGKLIILKENNEIVQEINKDTRCK